MSQAKSDAARSGRAALTELVHAARGRIILLAGLNFCWFMVLPATVWLLVDAQFAAVLAVAAGVGLEVLRLAARQTARRTLRLSSMSRATENALNKGSVAAEVLADSAFWSAHIVEYAASIDLPAIAGAALSIVVTLGLALSRTGFAPVAEVGGVLLGAVALGLVSNRWRRPGVYAIVDARERTATWMAAAVRDRGELASPRASAAFLYSVTSAVARWCDAEDRVERARTWHRLAIAFAACAALYAVARSYGLDPLAAHLTGERLLGRSFSGAAVLGASLPAAYALAVHLDSWAIASSELSRLTLNTGEPKLTKGTSLTRAPTRLRAVDLTVRHGSNLALNSSNLDLALDHPIGIAGPNGSGKTTLATVIAGLLVPSSGKLLLDDCPAVDVDRDDIAFVPQDPVLIEPLSILENLRLVASEFAESDALELLRTLGLECSLETPAGNLSRGEQRRIAIARALLKKPQILVLDEPDAWLDVAGRRALLATLQKAASSARVLIVSHRPDVLLRLETVIVLNAEHRIEGIDTPARLTEHSATFRAILGKEPANALE